MSRRRIEGAATGLFPAKADPTTDRVSLVGQALAGKTSGVTLQNLRVLLLASSRLKPVLPTDRVSLVGLALAGKTSGVTLQSLRVQLLASSRLKPVLLNISVRQKSPDNH